MLRKGRRKWTQLMQFVASETRFGEISPILPNRNYFCQSFEGSSSN